MRSACLPLKFADGDSLRTFTFLILSKDGVLKVTVLIIRGTK